jgi:hypothetical protein
MRPKVRSKAITSAAKDKPCTVRISSFVPGYQCSGDDTTVFTHFGDVTKGTSTKVSDLDGGFGCANCHAIVDGVDRKRLEYLLEKYPAALEARLRASVSETLAILIDEGVITVKGAKII